MTHARLAPLVGVVVILLLLASCSNLTGSHANQVREWANAAGYSSLSAQISTDLVELGNGERLGELKDLRTACAGFAQDAASLEDELPTPDVTISNDLANALTDYYIAGNDCYDASAFGDHDYELYLAKLKAGKALYAKAVKRLFGFGVH